MKKKITFFNIAYWPESSEIVYSCWLIKETKLTTLMSIIKCVKLTNGNNKETFFLFTGHVVTSICIKQWEWELGGFAFHYGAKLTFNYWSEIDLHKSYHCQ